MCIFEAGLFFSRQAINFFFISRVLSGDFIISLFHFVSVMSTVHTVRVKKSSTNFQANICFSRVKSMRRKYIVRRLAREFCEKISTRFRVNKTRHAEEGELKNIFEELSPEDFREKKSTEIIAHCWLSGSFLEGASTQLGIGA